MRLDGIHRLNGKRGVRECGNHRGTRFTISRKTQIWGKALDNNVRSKRIVTGNMFGFALGKSSTV